MTKRHCYVTDVGIAIERQAQIDHEDWLAERLRQELEFRELGK